MGAVADRLFLEAVGLCDDTQEAGSYAKKFAAVHPALYLELLEHPKETNSQMLAEMGDEALKQIPKTYIIRSRIALKTAEYRIAAKEDRESLKKYYMTALKSDTNAVNYLRAVLNGFVKAEDRKNLSRAVGKFELEKALPGILGGVDQTQKELRISRAETSFYLSCFWMDSLKKF